VLTESRPGLREVNRREVLLQLKGEKMCALVPLSFHYAKRSPECRVNVPRGCVMRRYEAPPGPEPDLRSAGRDMAPGKGLHRVTSGTRRARWRQRKITFVGHRTPAAKTRNGAGRSG